MGKASELFTTLQIGDRSLTVPSSEHIVVDPSLKEEAVMDGRMTIALNEFGEICAVQKAGGI